MIGLLHGTPTVFEKWTENIVNNGIQEYGKNIDTDVRAQLVPEMRRIARCFLFLSHDGYIDEKTLPQKMSEDAFQTLCATVTDDKVAGYVATSLDTFSKVVSYHFDPHGQLVKPGFDKSEESDDPYRGFMTYYEIRSTSLPLRGAVGTIRTTIRETSELFKKVWEADKDIPAEVFANYKQLKADFGLCMQHETAASVGAPPQPSGGEGESSASAAAPPPAAPPPAAPPPAAFVAGSDVNAAADALDQPTVQTHAVVQHAGASIAVLRITHVPDTPIPEIDFRRQYQMLVALLRDIDSQTSQTVAPLRLTAAQRRARFLVYLQGLRCGAVDPSYLAIHATAPDWYGDLQDPNIGVAQVGTMLLIKYGDGRTAPDVMKAWKLAGKCTLAWVSYQFIAEISKALTALVNLGPKDARSNYPPPPNPPRPQDTPSTPPLPPARAPNPDPPGPPAPDPPDPPDPPAPDPPGPPAPPPPGPRVPVPPGPEFSPNDHFLTAAGGTELLKGLESLNARFVPHDEWLPVTSECAKVCCIVSNIWLYVSLACQNPTVDMILISASASDQVPTEQFLYRVNTKAAAADLNDLLDDIHFAVMNNWPGISEEVVYRETETEFFQAPITGTTVVQYNPPNAGMTAVMSRPYARVTNHAIIDSFMHIRQRTSNESPGFCGYIANAWSSFRLGMTYALVDPPMAFYVNGKPQQDLLLADASPGAIAVPIKSHVLFVNERQRYLRACASMMANSYTSSNVSLEFAKGLLTEEYRSSAEMRLQTAMFLDQVATFCDTTERNRGPECYDAVAKMKALVNESQVAIESVLCFNSTVLNNGNLSRLQADMGISNRGVKINNMTGVVPARTLNYVADGSFFFRFGYSFFRFVALSRQDPGYDQANRVFFAQHAGSISLNPEETRTPSDKETPRPSAPEYSSGPAQLVRPKTLVGGIVRLFDTSPLTKCSVLDALAPLHRVSAHAGPGDDTTLSMLVGRARTLVHEAQKAGGAGAETAVSPKALHLFCGTTPRAATPVDAPTELDFAKLSLLCWEEEAAAATSLDSCAQARVGSSLWKQSAHRLAVIAASEQAALVSVYSASNTPSEVAYTRRNAARVAQKALFGLSASERGARLMHKPQLLHLVTELKVSAALKLEKRPQPVGPGLLGGSVCGEYGNLRALLPAGLTSEDAVGIPTTRKIVQSHVRCYLPDVDDASPASLNKDAMARVKFKQRSYARRTSSVLQRAAQVPACPLTFTLQSHGSLRRAPEKSDVGTAIRLQAAFMHHLPSDNTHAVGGALDFVDARMRTEHRRSHTCMSILHHQRQFMSDMLTISGNLAVCNGLMPRGVLFHPLGMPHTDANAAWETGRLFDGVPTGARNVVRRTFMDKAGVRATLARELSHRGGSGSKAVAHSFDAACAMFDSLSHTIACLPLEQSAAAAEAGLRHIPHLACYFLFEEVSSARNAAFADERQLNFSNASESARLKAQLSRCDLFAESVRFAPRMSQDAAARLWIRDVLPETRSQRASSETQVSISTTLFDTSASVIAPTPTPEEAVHLPDLVGGLKDDVQAAMRVCMSYHAPNQNDVTVLQFSERTTGRVYVYTTSTLDAYTDMEDVKEQLRNNFGQIENLLDINTLCVALRNGRTPDHGDIDNQAHIGLGGDNVLHPLQDFYLRHNNTTSDTAVEDDLRRAIRTAVIMKCSRRDTDGHAGQPFNASNATSYPLPWQVNACDKDEMARFPHVGSRMDVPGGVNFTPFAVLSAAGYACHRLAQSMRRATPPLGPGIRPELDDLLQSTLLPLADMKRREERLYEHAILMARRASDRSGNNGVFAIAAATVTIIPAAGFDNGALSECNVNAACDRLAALADIMHSLTVLMHLSSGATVTCRTANGNTMEYAASSTLDLMFGSARIHEGLVHSLVKCARITVVLTRLRVTPAVQNNSHGLARLTPNSESGYFKFRDAKHSMDHVYGAPLVAAALTDRRGADRDVLTQYELLDNRRDFPVEKATQARTLDAVATIFRFTRDVVEVQSTGDMCDASFDVFQYCLTAEVARRITGALEYVGRERVKVGAPPAEEAAAAVGAGTATPCDYDVVAALHLFKKRGSEVQEANDKVRKEIMPAFHMCRFAALTGKPDLLFDSSTGRLGVGYGELLKLLADAATIFGLPVEQLFGSPEGIIFFRELLIFTLTYQAYGDAASPNMGGISDLFNLGTERDATQQQAVMMETLRRLLASVDAIALAMVTWGILSHTPLKSLKDMVVASIMWFVNQAWSMRFDDRRGGNGPPANNPGGAGQRDDGGAFGKDAKRLLSKYTLEGTKRMYDAMQPQDTTLYTDPSTETAMRLQESAAAALKAALSGAAAQNVNIGTAFQPESNENSSVDALPMLNLATGLNPTMPTLMGAFAAQAQINANHAVGNDAVMAANGFNLLGRMGESYYHQMTRHTSEVSHLRYETLENPADSFPSSGLWHLTDEAQAAIATGFSNLQTATVTPTDHFVLPLGILLMNQHVAVMYMLGMCVYGGVKVIGSYADGSRFSRAKQIEYAAQPVSIKDREFKFYRWNQSEERLVRFNDDRTYTAMGSSTLPKNFLLNLGGLMAQLFSRFDYSFWQNDVLRVIWGDLEAAKALRDGGQRNARLDMEIQSLEQNYIVARKSAYYCTEQFQQSTYWRQVDDYDLNNPVDKASVLGAAPYLSVTNQVPTAVLHCVNFGFQYLFVVDHKDRKEQRGIENLQKAYLNTVLWGQDAGTRTLHALVGRVMRTGVALGFTESLEHIFKSSFEKNTPHFATGGLGSYKNLEQELRLSSRKDSTTGQAVPLNTAITTNSLQWGVNYLGAHGARRLLAENEAVVSISRSGHVYGILGHSMQANAKALSQAEAPKQMLASMRQSTAGTTTWMQAKFSSAMSYVSTELSDYYAVPEEQGTRFEVVLGDDAKIFNDPKKAARCFNLHALFYLATNTSPNAGAQAPKLDQLCSEITKQETSDIIRRAELILGKGGLDVNVSPDVLNPTAAATLADRKSGPYNPNMVEVAKLIVSEVSGSLHVYNKQNSLPQFPDRTDCAPLRTAVPASGATGTPPPSEYIGYISSAMSSAAVLASVHLQVEGYAHALGEVSRFLHRNDAHGQWTRTTRVRTLALVPAATLLALQFGLNKFSGYSLHSYLAEQHWITMACAIGGVQASIFDAVATLSQYLFSYCGVERSDADTVTDTLFDIDASYGNVAPGRDFRTKLRDWLQERNSPHHAARARRVANAVTEIASGSVRANALGLPMLEFRGQKAKGSKERWNALKSTRRKVVQNVLERGIPARPFDSLESALNGYWSESQAHKALIEEAASAAKEENLNRPNYNAKNARIAAELTVEADLLADCLVQRAVFANEYIESAVRASVKDSPGARVRQFVAGAATTGMGLFWWDWITGLLGVGYAIRACYVDNEARTNAASRWLDAVSRQDHATHPSKGVYGALKRNLATRLATGDTGVADNNKSTEFFKHTQGSVYHACEKLIPKAPNNNNARQHVRYEASGDDNQSKSVRMQPYFASTLASVHRSGQPYEQQNPPRRNYGGGDDLDLESHRVVTAMGLYELNGAPVTRNLSNDAALCVRAVIAASRSEPPPNNNSPNAAITISDANQTLHEEGDAYLNRVAAVVSGHLFVVHGSDDERLKAIMDRQPPLPFVGICKLSAQYSRTLADVTLAARAILKWYSSDRTANALGRIQRLPAQLTPSSDQPALTYSDVVYFFLADTNIFLQESSLRSARRVFDPRFADRRTNTVAQDADDASDANVLSRTMAAARDFYRRNVTGDDAASAADAPVLRSDARDSLDLYRGPLALTYGT